jgi:hypothetical protein
VHYLFSVFIHMYSFIFLWHTATKVGINNKNNSADGAFQIIINSEMSSILIAPLRRSNKNSAFNNLFYISHQIEWYGIGDDASGNRATGLTDPFHLSRYSEKYASQLSDI